MYKIQQAAEEESINAYTFHSKIATIWGLIIPNFSYDCVSECICKKGKRQ